jgi:thiopeptide-type bacteriocin biosynthesis protein
MRAAEAVFAADSQVVTAALRHLPAAVIDPLALAAVNMVDIVCGFHANLPEAMEWLAAQPAQAMPGIERGVVDQVAGLTARGVPHDLPDWPEPVTVALQARADALASYRAYLPAAANVDGVVESLLHMHHNRARGIDPDGERICRRLARQAAITWRARNGAGR